LRRGRIQISMIWGSRIDGQRARSSFMGNSKSPVMIGFRLMEIPFCSGRGWPWWGLDAVAETVGHKVEEGLAQSQA
ncbi:MAG: hypothetical protein R6V45_05540, partial [Oceanipulchritudo sp.]